MVICPDCGKEVPKAKFCKNCGAHIAEIEEVSAPEIDLSNNSSNQSPETAVKYCRNCGYEIDGEFKFCPNCGEGLFNTNESVNTVVKTDNKNILVAIILSIIFPGFGQFYLKLNHKGVLFIISYIISVFLIIILIGLILCAVIWIWALVDTIQSTNAINRGEYVEDKLLGR